MFRALDDAAFRALGDTMTRVELARGEVLFREGDTGDKLYVVIDGKIKMSRSYSDGRECMLDVLGPGDMFGELSLFDPGPRASTTTALTQAELLWLGQAELTGWLRSHPELVRGMLHQLASRLRIRLETVGDLMFSDVSSRVAKKLLELAERFGAETPHGVYVHHDLTQEELAQLVGATRETVNKALGDFVGRGWIQLEQKAVLVLEPERLAQRVH